MKMGLGAFGTRHRCNLGFHSPKIKSKTHVKIRLDIYQEIAIRIKLQRLPLPWTSHSLLVRVVSWKQIMNTSFFALESLHFEFYSKDMGTKRLQILKCLYPVFDVLPNPCLNIIIKKETLSCHLTIWKFIVWKKNETFTKFFSV